MVEYSLRDFLDGRAILSGVIIALSITGLTFVIAPYVLSDDNNPGITPGSWDITSPIDVAESLNEHIDNLLYAQVQIFQVTETYPNWGGESVGYFHSEISRIILFKQLQSVAEGDIISPDDPLWEEGIWQMNIERLATSEIISDINGTFINQELQTSLATDLGTINSLQNITNSYQQAIEESELLNDIIFWEIDQVYNDGTRIRIKLFDQTIYIQQTTAVGFIRIENSFGIISDSTMTTPPSYTGETGANPFGNYENAINDLLLNILGGN
ncbi:MAG: hypothetical protein GPJ54_14905 [Candidatus Heimdallarchaeota archaeon]|nr:hypothetical protein [Candidatus Heimdallarchaeota archaeon]